MQTGCDVHHGFQQGRGHRGEGLSPEAAKRCASLRRALPATTVPARLNADGEIRIGLFSRQRSGAMIAPDFLADFAFNARLNHVTAGSHVLPVCNSTALRASCFDGYGCACMPSSIKPGTGLISNASPTVSICPITVSPSESSVFPSSPDTKYTTSATLCAPYAYCTSALLFHHRSGPRSRDQVREGGVNVRG
jgi:hypothetical protein